MIHAVIMAGGSGTRFWPLSRAARPKQFLALTGKDPLIVETAKRVSGMKTWVVCGTTHAPLVKKVLKRAAIVVEPQARNTAPAIALATAHVAHADSDALIAVLPSDQHVTDVPAFRAALDTALETARQGFIVTLGITPTRPDTGYGYIRLGDPLTSRPDPVVAGEGGDLAARAGRVRDGDQEDGSARLVKQFVEKPDLPTAQGYLKSGDYVWNAGMFVFRADVMLKAFERHMPELHAALTELRAVIGTKKYDKALKALFPKMPATSIDYGIAERADNIAVVPGAFGWSDVGSFNALPDVRPLDAQGNVAEGQALVIDSKGCVVLARERPVAVVGMTDTVVVDAGDAILVLPKDKSQDVRKVIEQLKANKKLSRYL